MTYDDVDQARQESRQAACKACDWQITGPMARGEAETHTHLTGHPTQFLYTRRLDIFKKEGGETPLEP